VQYMCNVNVANRISCLPYIFLRRDWGGFDHPCHPTGYAPEGSEGRNEGTRTSKMYENSP